MKLFKNIFWWSNSKKWYFEDEWGYSLSSIWWNSDDISEEKLLKLYSGWVFWACDAIWDWLAWLWKAIFKDEAETERIEHDHLKLFDYKLVKAIAIFLKTLWAVYVYKEKAWNRVVKLLLLNPLSVSVERDEFNNVIEYKYVTEKGFYTFKKEDVVEFSTFSPIFSVKWMTPLKAVASQVATDLASVKFNKMFFENGWKPWTVLSSEVKIDTDVKKKYIAKFKQDFMWIDNSHKVMFADQWIKIDAFNVSNKEMESTQQRTFTMDEVLMMFRVPKPILWKSDWVWYADKQVPWFYLNEYTLKPLARQMIEVLNEDEDLFKNVWYFSFIFPKDKEELLKEYQANLITRNQYLIATWKKPFKNWNVFWDWEEWIVEEEKKEVKLESKLEKSLQKAFWKSLKKKVEENKFWSEAYNEKFWKTKILRTDKYEKTIESKMKKIFEIQRKEIVKQIEWKKWIKALKEDDLIPKKKSLLQYITMFTPFFKDMMWKEWKLTIEEISDETFAIAKLNKWIWERVEAMSEDIDKTTRKEIFAVIKQWNRDKVWSAQIVANVNKKFSLYSKKKWRVSMIARTEITRSSNKAQEEAYIQSWVVVYKQWYTALDERVSPQCKLLHWTKIKLWWNFIKKWEKDSLWNLVEYEDVKYPPRHPNCRCVLRPVIED